eukprot:3542117-Pleurochrysis_carterae.AAC.1
MTEPTSFTCPSSIGKDMQDHVGDAQTPCRAAEVHKCHKYAQSFANAKDVQCHLRFHCRRFQSGSVRSASSGSSACDSSLASVKRQRTHSEEEQFKTNLEHYRMSSISSFRHRRNLGDATIKAVTEILLRHAFPCAGRN